MAVEKSGIAKDGTEVTFCTLITFSMNFLNRVVSIFQCF